MDRVYNFSAGPSAMPLEVLEQAKADLLNFQGEGLSVMEMSHRSPAFQGIMDRAEAALRRIMDIPEEYAVLFLQGGASLQFSEVPMNLAAQGDTTAYAVTGNFSGKAFKEAQRWTNAIEVASSKDKNFTYIPKITEDMLPADAKYLHICGNNTIFGTTYHSLPQHGNIPLVADWSSAILGKVINIKDYDLVYAGAQKNMGPAGVTAVILKRSIGDNTIDPIVPTMMQYKPMIDNGSLYNTPPCWAIYMSMLMFEWIEKEGGVKAMEDINIEKSSRLYNFIDNSKLYTNPVNHEDRSITNVVFTLPTQEQTADFISFAKSKGITNIKGHKLVGGCRASIYNGVELKAVDALIDCMKEFELK